MKPIYLECLNFTALYGIYFVYEAKFCKMLQMSWYVWDVSRCLDP